MLIQPIDQARQNIAHIRALIGLAQAVSAQTTPAVSVDDIFRATVVLSVSALDHYVHEKALNDMLDVHRGIRPIVPKFAEFEVGLAAARIGIGAPSSDAWLESEIRTRNGYLTFQRPDKIADALRHATSVSVWPAVAALMGLPAVDVRSRLDLTVNRRNQIAHEADCIPGAYGARWPIDPVLAVDTVDFISEIIEALDAVA